MSAPLSRRLAVARGDEPADLVVQGGKVLSVFTREWLDATAGLPLDVYFMASSCVPASHFESPRRELTPGDLDALLRRRRVIGLAEMMNFPGVIGGAPAELAKLELAKHVDGHAPGVLG